MSGLPLRKSYQVTIAPPAPSEMIVGLSWLLMAVHTVAPSYCH